LRVSWNVTATGCRVVEVVDDCMTAYWMGFAVGVACVVPVLAIAWCWHTWRLRKLVDNARAAGRLAQVGTLAGGLAHEIRNPLSTLSLQLEILEEEFAGAEDPAARRTLAKVRALMEEVERLRDILDDFLQYARPHQLEPQITDLNELVEQVAEFVEPDALRQKVKIMKLLDEDLPAFALDPNKIKQALLNIVLNAQEAMPDGGEIMLRSSVKGKNACLSITDTGCGIAQEDLDKIFRVYYTSGKPGGSGLGLATAQRIIEDHGGEIRVRSEVGKGTELTVTLPIVTDTDAPVEP